MSLSRKKYSFHRKINENKQSYNINPSLNCIENENEIQDNNEQNFDEKVKNEDLIFKINSNNNLNKKIVSYIPLTNPNINNKKEDENKEKNNIESNPNLQYLINKNEEENFDFINTLLKLKGISMEATKGYKSSKNIKIIKNLTEDNENIFIPQSSKANNDIFINNQNKNNKSIPTNCSTSTSKINTINNNYNNNQNEEAENYKNIDMVTFSTNEINNNYKDNINNNVVINKDIKKIDPNSLLKELTTLDNKENKKINSIYSHSNKDTISSECNTYNTAKKYIKKETFNESISSKDCYTNIKSPEKSNDNKIKIDEDKNNEINKKIKNRALIPINKNKNNKSFYKKNININKNNADKNNEKLNISLENKILKKKSIKRIPHNKKQIYEINNNMNNNKIDNNEKKSKSKSKNSHILTTDIKNHKRKNSKIENIKSEIKKEQKGKKIQNLKSSELFYNNISLIHNEAYNNNIKDNSNIIKILNKNLTTEIKQSSIIDEKNEKSNERKKEEAKGHEQIKEIDLKEIRKNCINDKQLVNNNKINYIIKSKKENSIFDIPFNSERKTTKIFKINDKIKSGISQNSQNRSNIISSLNPRNKSNKNNQKYNRIINNLNSYVIIAKNRNFISPHPKTKNKKYTTNIKDGEFFSKNHENSHYNFSFNLINDNILKNYNKKNDDKKVSKLLNKIEKYSFENDEEDNINKTIDMNDGEFCDDGIAGIKTVENKANNKNNKINIKQKKTKSSKFAEIFLFDNEDKEKEKEKEKDISKNNPKEKNDNLIENKESKKD